VHEALRAADALAAQGLAVRVVDAYSVKPIDAAGLRAHARETGGRVLVVEDHRPEGGLGEAVAAALAEEPGVTLRCLGVRGIPGSGPAEALLRSAGIDAEGIARGVQALVAGRPAG
jgi:transketolase